MPRRFLLFCVVLMLVPLPAVAAAKKVPRAPSRARKVTRTPVQSRALVDRIVTEIGEQVWTHGDYYWHEGRYEDQVAICRLVSCFDPGYAEAYSSGGWLLENLGRYDDALLVYEEGVRKVPNDWRPLHDLGYFHYQRKRYPQAVEYLEKAVKQNPPSFVWHVLAHSYEKSGNREQSIATWRECVERFPEDGAAQHNLRRMEGPAEPADSAASDPQ
jgi:tetratricopeptide (TPR) repeat protein